MLIENNSPAFTTHFYCLTHNFLIVWLSSYNDAICFNLYVWAPASEFVSSSIPSWQILTAHAQPFRGARDMAFCLKVPLDSLIVWASSEGSGETARMRSLAWTFTARIGNKYQIHLTRPICYIPCYIEDLTWVVISYEINETRWDFIALKVDIFSIENIMLSQMASWRYAPVTKCYVRVWSYNFSDTALATE